MCELEYMSIEKLLELLADETLKLTRLFSAKKFENDYRICKERILEIQEVIKLRLQGMANNLDSSVK
jgi:hypothetical protein